MKNKDIIFLQEWKKRKQQASKKVIKNTGTAQTFVDLETFLQETNEEHNAKDSLSGMLIW